MGKKHEDICVLRQTSPKMTSAEDEVNNQVDRMAYSVDTSYSSATSVIAQWAHEQSGLGVGMKVVYALYCVSR